MLSDSKFTVVTWRGAKILLHQYNYNSYKTNPLHASFADHNCNLNVSRLEYLYIRAPPPGSLYLLGVTIGVTTLLQSRIDVF